jgi:hypothetical protein
MRFAAKSIVMPNGERPKIYPRYVWQVEIAHYNDAVHKSAFLGNQFNGKFERSNLNITHEIDG